MKKLFVLLLSAVLLSACSGSDDEPKVPQQPQAPVTVWAYLVADTNLKSYLRNNIKNMYEGLSQVNKQATLLVYWDGGTSDTYFAASPCILRYTTDGNGNINGVAARDSSYSIRTIAEQAEIVMTYNDQLSTDKKVMSRVLEDMKSFSPADKTVLTAGSHGSAWIETILASRASRSFGQDGSGTNNTITTWDMADAITDAGIKLDLMLFDACMMGTAEVCYDFKNAANYMIVSPLDVPAPGFPYHNFMTYLYEGTTAAYTEVCKQYVEYYRNYPSGWASISLTDCSQMDNLAAVVKNQLAAHKETLYEYNPIDKLQQYGLNPYATGFKYLSFDAKQFMEDLNGGTAPTDFLTQLNRTVLYADCLENTEYYTIEKSKYCGLGMYIPVSIRAEWNTTFKTLGWYTAAGWDEVTFSWEN